MKAVMFSVPLRLSNLSALFHDVLQDPRKGRYVSVVTQLQLKPVSQPDAQSSASQAFPSHWVLFQGGEIEGRGVGTK